MIITDEDRLKAGRGLVTYTNKRHGCYDPVFNAEIRRLRPDWFDVAATNKKKLLKMAKAGKPRPKPKKLSIQLTSYTCSGHTSYDSDFDTKIRALAPDWFNNAKRQRQTAKNKMELLEIAKGPRPNSNTRIGQQLLRYTTNGASCYDPTFDTKIRKAAPHWWLNTAKENRERLLQMAKAGERRPAHKTKLGRALMNYTKADADPVFNAEIRRLSKWFENTATKKKEKLLQMAKAGESRPHKVKTKLGRCLASYILKTHPCYDPIFDAKIRRLSKWFENTATKNKEKLLQMAEAGEPRPHKKIKLGRLFNNYICKTGTCYDPVFDAEIRRLRPDWFRK